MWATRWATKLESSVYEAALGVVGRHAVDPGEQQWMVGDQQLQRAAIASSTVPGTASTASRIRLDVLVRIAADQAHRVPGLGPARRVPLVHRGDDLAQLRHGQTYRPAIRDQLSTVRPIPMTLPFDDDRVPRELAPGAVHVPGWLDLDAQRRLVAACREWSRPPAGMRATRVGSGVMSAQTVCLGWHWRPYEYSRTADDGAPVKPFPSWLADLARSALVAAGISEAYDPDVALINFYDADAKMGMHQDRDERSPAPVVSLSLGDTGVFRFGNTENRNRPWTDIELASGDLFVFSGPSRLAYHGVLRDPARHRTRPGRVRPPEHHAARVRLGPARLPPKSRRKRTSRKHARNQGRLASERLVTVGRLSPGALRRWEHR